MLFSLSSILSEGQSLTTLDSWCISHGSKLSQGQPASHAASWMMIRMFSFNDISVKLFFPLFLHKNLCYFIVRMGLQIWVNFVFSHSNWTSFNRVVIPHAPQWDRKSSSICILVNDALHVSLLEGTIWGDLAQVPLSLSFSLSPLHLSSLIPSHSFSTPLL